MVRSYAGIGARNTPEEILDLMAGAACNLEEKGFILNSGGASGADTVFEQAVRSWQNKKIFIPWDGFNGRRNGHEVYAPSLAVQDQCLKLAGSLHPAWDRCSKGARAMHARNVRQILGPWLSSPVDFVICWTEGGKAKGGTGQALRIAKAYDIPIIDLGGMSVAEAETRITKLI